MSTGDPWYHHHDEVLAFAGVLASGGQLDTPRDVVYYFEKPHKWDNAHELWVGCNRPDPDTREDLQSWCWFLSKLDQQERTS